MPKGYDKDGVDIFEKTAGLNAVQQMIEQKTAFIKQINFFAELRWIKYKALLKHGFSKEEALSIVEKTQIFS